MLNPDIDIDGLADRFAARQRIQIQNVLQPEAAGRLFDCLDKEVNWTLAYIDDNGPQAVGQEKFRNLSRLEQSRFNKKILQRARSEFQFLYNSYMMVTAYKAGRDPGLLLHGVLEYLNSTQFIEAMRRITGVSAIRKADAQATRYLPGHFLRCHDDRSPVQQGREVAYVLNLTKQWQPDWGGLLHFYDANGDIVETLMPRFNTLTLFRVPTNHFVSQVSSFATEPRYAITGWMRSDYA